MIERAQFGHEITCDFCVEFEALDSEQFTDAVDEAKEKGWIIFREKGDWLHKCKDCNGSHPESEFGPVVLRAKDTCQKPESRKPTTESVLKFMKFHNDLVDFHRIFV